MERGAREELARVQGYLGDTLRRLGRLTEAEDWLKQGFASQLAMAKQLPSSQATQLALLEFFPLMASLCDDFGQPRIGLHYRHNALELAELYPPEWRTQLGCLRRLAAVYETASRLFFKIGQPHNAAQYQADYLEAKSRLLALSEAPKPEECEQAVVLARRALALDPDNGDKWATLAIACYRAERWAEVVEAADKAAALGTLHDRLIAFMSAVAHDRLGCTDQAAALYFAAANPRGTYQDHWFQPEVAQALGIRVKTADRRLPASGDSIPVAQVKAGGEEADCPGLRLIDGSGLEDVDGDGLLEHDTLPDHMWLSSSGTGAVWLEFDLGGVPTLGQIRLWNYNADLATRHGAAQLDISVWNPGVGWRKITNDFVLAEAQDRFDYDEPTIVPLGSVNAGRVRFDDFRSVDGSDQVGLSKVRFFGPCRPTPSQPQPAHGGNLVVGPKARLKWEPGQSAVLHRIHLGTDPEHLELIGEVRGGGEIDLPKLESCRWYCWRVEAETEDGQIHEGPIWAFSTGEMVAWWPFEESDVERVTDVSGRGHHGEFRGDAHVVVDPERGPVLSLDGREDYVDCGDDPEFDLTTGFTLSVWVWIEKRNQFYDAILAKGNDTWRLQRKPNSNRIVLGCDGLRPSTTTGIGVTVESSNELKFKNWHHLAGVFDGSRLAIYLDGRLEGLTAAYAGALDTSDHPLYIGNNTLGGFNGCWIGRIDDVRIYRGALGREQIEKIRQGLHPGGFEPPEWFRELRAVAGGSRADVSDPS
jgi:tetratricopeptide (TPR) repeat protein